MSPWWRLGLATSLDPVLPWRQPDLACRYCRADLPSPPRRSALAPSTLHVRDPPCALRRPIKTGYTRSAAAVSFWFARSLIGIESPTARRPRAFYSNIDIDFIDTVFEYYVHLRRATGLLLCSLIEPQHCCPCVRFAVASPSPSSVHRRLCCAIPAAPSVCTGLRPDWVFVIELPVPASSLRPTRRRVFSRIASSLSSTTTWLGPSPLYAWYWQH